MAWRPARRPLPSPRPAPRRRRSRPRPGRARARGRGDDLPAARRASAQIADAKKDFTALSKEVRATLDAQYKSAGKTATPKLDELSGRALAAIALNQTGGFSRTEVSAAKAALQSRERESATGAIKGGSFAAYSQTLVTQYDAMSSEERQARVERAHARCGRDAGRADEWSDAQPVRSDGVIRRSGIDSAPSRMAGMRITSASASFVPSTCGSSAGVPPTCVVTAVPVHRVRSLRTSTRVSVMRVTTRGRKSCLRVGRLIRTPLPQLPTLTSGPATGAGAVTRPRTSRSIVTRA